MGEVFNLLLNIIDSAQSILSIKLTSCVSCVSCVAGRALKLEDSWDVSEPPAIGWFEDEPSESAIVRCILIASDACDAVRSRVLLPMWANSLSVRIEVNVIDARADISLELTVTPVTRRAELMPQSRTQCDRAAP